MSRKRTHLASCLHEGGRWFCAADCPHHVIVDVDAERRPPAKRKSRKRSWSVTVTIDGRDRGSWRDVRAVEPWTAVYYVLRYGIAKNYELRDIDGMTITVRPDPVPPTVPSAPAGTSERGGA